MVMLDRQITLRQELVQNINSEIRQIEQDIVWNSQRIGLLEADLIALKEEYGRLIYESYKNRSAHGKLMYIFSSEDFNQAYYRLKVMQQYASVRKTQAQAIEQTRLELEQANEDLRINRKKKEKLAGVKLSENEQLARDKEEREKTLVGLKSQEQTLRKKQRDQEAEKQKLNQAIQRIIDDEIKSSREKNNGKYELTPEGKIEAVNFEKGKAKLPWPVQRGVVTGKYGKQAHPFLPGITIDNKGIDITTDPGSPITAIFEGEVTKVFSITGAGLNIIITHGAYKSVYTNLRDLKVKAGDRVTARQVLGTCLTEGEKTICHLEIWQVNATGGTPLDPLNWLAPK